MTSFDSLRTALSSLAVLVAVLLGSIPLLQLWDMILQRRFSSPVARYRQLGMSEPLLREGLRWWSLLLIGGLFTLLIVLGAWPLAIAWAVVVGTAPEHVLQFAIRHRSLHLESQLVTACTGLANALRAGMSIPQGLRSVADDTPRPLGKELERIVYQTEHGRPVGDVLAAMRRRLQLEPFTLFCLALEVSDERGGPVNQVLKRLSAAMQEWLRLRRKLEGDTSAGRYAILIMGLCPAAFILLFLAVGMTQTLKLFTDLYGQMVLTAIILLIWAGVRWAMTIMAIRIS